MLGIFGVQPEQAFAADNTTPVLAKGQAAGSTAVKVTWKEVAGAQRYVIYFAECGDPSFEKEATLKKSETSYKDTGLQRGHSYKYIVAAQKKVKGKYKTFAKSVKIHVLTNGARTNPKKVTLNKKSLSLNKGKTATLSAKVVKKNAKKALLDSTHEPKVRYVSSDKSVAKVNSKGKVTAVDAGSCTVYAIAVNGVYAACKVTVKAPAPAPAPTPAPAVKKVKVTYYYPSAAHNWLDEPIEVARFAESLEKYVNDEITKEDLMDEFTVFALFELKDNIPSIADRLLHLGFIDEEDTKVLDKLASAIGEELTEMGFNAGDKYVTYTEEVAEGSTYTVKALNAISDFKEPVSRYEKQVYIDGRVTYKGWVTQAFAKDNGLGTKDGLFMTKQPGEYQGGDTFKATKSVDIYAAAYVDSPS